MRKTHEIAYGNFNCILVLKYFVAPKYSWKVCTSNEERRTVASFMCGPGEKKAQALFQLLGPNTV
jgi:hypothetical protein